MSRGEHSSASLRDFSRKALVDLKDVIKLYTEQLRLMEKHCAMLKRECNSNDIVLENTRTDVADLRREICRREVGGRDSADELERCAAYATERGWSDIAHYYSEWAKSASRRTVKTGGGA